MSEPLAQYKGSHTFYTDVAAKGDVRMGLGIDYAVHPGNAIGYIVVRFVARHVSEGSPSDLGTFTHFNDREGAKFVMKGADSAHMTMFKGRRLNKVLIPAFNPAPCGHQIAKIGDEYNIWEPIAAWIHAQIEKEDGFTLLMDDLTGYIRAQVAGPEQETPVLVLEFADLPKPSKKKAPKPLKDEDDDEDDDEDTDEDEEGWKVN